MTSPAVKREEAPAKREAAPVATVDDRGISKAADEIIRIIDRCVTSGVSVEHLERLAALHERMSDRAAGQEFAYALAEFQRVCPSIAKSSKANVTTKSGVRYSYNYAELDEIAATIRPLLHERGLSYSWDSTIEGDMLRCVCNLRHINGHKESASFSCPWKTDAGMSEQQKYAAALSYARRQSLVQVLGLTTTDPDTDAGSTETITASQAADLKALIQEVKADPELFLAWAKVDRVEDIKATEYRAAVTLLQAKRKAPK
jgi:ERF superfamily protein